MKIFLALGTFYPLDYDGLNHFEIVNLKDNSEKGFTCACKTNYVPDANGNCVFDQSVCADKLANVDWKGMNAASTTRPSATRFNGHKTDASGSKAIHAASVKLFQIENQKYKTIEIEKSPQIPVQKVIAILNG